MKHKWVVPAFAAALVFSADTGEADAAEAALPYFADDVYSEFTLSSDFGYDVGDRRYTGEKIERLDVNPDIYLLDAEGLSDSVLEKRAEDDSNVNYAIFRDGGLYKAPVRVNRMSMHLFNSGMIFSQQKYNDEIVKLVNAERRNRGLAPVSYSYDLFKGADIRTMEMTGYGDIRYEGRPHVRPDGTSFSTAFRYLNAYGSIGENTLQMSYKGNPYELLSEKALAERAYNQWKASPAHYAQMVNPAFKSIAVGIQIAPPRENGYFDYFYSQMTLHSSDFK